MMPRKNYASKKARRTQREELPVISPYFGADVTDLWSVDDNGQVPESYRIGVLDGRGYCTPAGRSRAASPTAA